MGTSALALMVVMALLVAVYFARRRKRQRAIKLRELQPAAREGDDLAYVYYADVAGIKRLAAGLTVALPIELSYSETGPASATARGVGLEESDEIQRSLPTDINFPALSRDIRLHVHAARLSTDVTLLPDLEARGDPGRRSTEVVLERKLAQLDAIARSQKLLLVRGHMQVLETGDDSVTTLELTHLSAGRFAPVDGRGRGDAAAMIVPEGIAIRITLPASDALTAAGSERLERKLAFFGEAIAHSPTFDEERGTFTCTAEAVWGCPAPQDGSEETGM